MDGWMDGMLTRLNSLYKDVSVQKLVVSFAYRGSKETATATF